MKQSFAFPALAACMMLAACSGENEIRDAATVSIKALAVGGNAPADSAPKSFSRAEGHFIELETGLVNIFPVALERCASAQSAAKRLALAGLDVLLPAAQAHGSHAIAAPPGVFDAVGKADGVEQDLGSLSAAEGSYCGLRLVLLPVTGGDSSELRGKALAVGPCYYADSAGLPAALAAGTPHECFASTAAGASAEKLLSLATPLVLSGKSAAAVLRLRVAYNTWFDGLDMDKVQAGDAAEMAKLSARVLGSISVDGTTP